MWHTLHKLRLPFLRQNHFTLAKAGNQDESLTNNWEQEQIFLSMYSA